MNTTITFMAAALMFLSPAFASAEHAPDRSVTVRFHDYAGVPRPTIQSAQDAVTNLYAAIGVAVWWAPTIEHKRAIPLEPSEVGQLEDFSILLLDQRMARQHAASPSALGFAAVAEAGGGRVAYAFYDRVEATARRCVCPRTEVLGLVVAHELGHLLLGRWAHSRLGLMRPTWLLAELRRSRPVDVEFTPWQVERIHWHLSDEAHSRAGLEQVREIQDVVVFSTHSRPDLGLQSTRASVVSRK